MRANGHDVLVARKATLAWFGKDSSAHERFVHLVGADDTDPMDDAFIDDTELPCEPAVPGPRPAVEAVLIRQPGAAGIAHAHAHHGYSFAEIAAALGRSKSAVGRMLVAYETETMRTASTWPPADRRAATIPWDE
jgi:hypothetical protein